MTILMPEVLERVIQPVFDALPLEEALHHLVVTGPSEHTRAGALAAEAVADPVLAARPDLVAGLWLYVDELDKAHAACQDLNTPTGAFWHAIMHRREGDFSNAKYWFRRAVKHPALGRIDLTGGGAGSGTAVAAYDAQALVDRVEQAHRSGDADNYPALVAAQKKEGKALFGWCVKQ